MRSRAVKDLILILVIYGIYSAAIYLLSVNSVLDSLGVASTRQDIANTLNDEFAMWSFIVMGVSLVCMLAWYVLGEWGIKAHRASSGTYWLTWLILLVIVLGVAFVAYFEGPQPDTNAYVLALFYFGGGFLFYYFASVFCSPINAKYLIPPSRQVRSW